jgi:tetraacyldisaccharide 4'-kinase
MNSTRFFLLPLSFFYGFIVWLRNKLFDWGIFSSYLPPVPSIGIGNLSIGGTGKSPIAALIAAHFARKTKVIFISRGYGRKTRGFRLANEDDTAETIGDEPCQIKKSVPEIEVIVDANRVRAVIRALSEFPQTGLIIFDDIYQHRRVKPGINILLTEYSRPFFKDYLLPVGHLREFKSGKSRADIIIMTKSPPIFSPIERRHITQRLSPEENQKVFFSFLKYTLLIPYGGNDTSGFPFSQAMDKNTKVVAFCGIANPEPFENFIRENSSEYQLITFRDHHFFSNPEIQEIIARFNSTKSSRKIILTTEKDLIRIKGNPALDIPEQLPFFAIRIQPEFHTPDNEIFLKTLDDFIRK